MFLVAVFFCALGAGRQGRVSCELQHQSHSPCIGTLSFLPRHNGAPNLCGASSDEIHTFIGFVQTALLGVCSYFIYE